MAMFQQLLNGFLVCANPIVLLQIAIGVGWGIIGGAIPGISPSIAIVLALPFTYHMEPSTAIILLGGVYTGACYGSSIPAILIGTPGAPASAATVDDGYILGKKGLGLEALGVSLLVGVAGGLIGTLILCVFVIPLGKIALSFGAPEYFAVSVLGLTIVASVGGGSMIKSVISVIIGLAVATIGLDTFSGVPRFTMGIAVLSDGIDDVSAMIGLFAV
ncbi:MAG: tripartite tricarboxylate transporter permease, partial [Holosporales bacterium]|nr:tripartite tricarboxylate transporter permease [Holosporales bacterium]